MQLQMSTKEKFVYGFIALAAVLMTIEYKYQPVAITVDVAHFAAERIGKGHPQTTASIQSQTPHAAKVSIAKSHTKASPSSGEHVVAEGETAYSIAKKYHVEVKPLCALNGLDEKCTIHPGQKLTVAKQ